nr:hypothetical protein BaRGS_012810 [Batillaria attramentaria]
MTCSCPYAHENEDFVMQHLVPELEGRLGLRLCLHKRDFIPGKGIIENISDCVEASKKVLVIFSTDFARSPWCQFELSLSLSYVLDNDDSLVVVSLHDIPSRDLTVRHDGARYLLHYQWLSAP